MGFKKGRSARAAANLAASQAAQNENDAAVADALNIRHDGRFCVYYTGPNGGEYKIDVAAMEQENVKKGTQRPVQRRQGRDKKWTMWLYEASRAAGRCTTRSSTSYIQYPKWVGFVLEERWQYLKSVGDQDVSEKAQLEAWSKIVSKLDELSFRSIFTVTDASWPHKELRTCNAPSCLETEESLDNEHALSHIFVLSKTDAALQEALFDRIVKSKTSPLVTAHAVRWLLQGNFKASPHHCRKIALSCGCLNALRILIVEAKVDVCGLELLETGIGSSGKHFVEGNGGWIQHCKHAVKILLARGAVLGSQELRSKLLKRLENDGDRLWASRVLNAMNETFPEFVIQQLRLFLGL